MRVTRIVSAQSAAARPGARPRRVHTQTKRPRSGQRGAFGVMAPFALLMALLFTGLSIDAGRLWFERRATQRAADMSALASARYTGCGSSVGQAENSAQETAKANGIDIKTVAVATGVLTTDATGNYVFSAAPVDTSNATQVTLSRTVPASVLLGGLIGDNVTFVAKAVAQGGPPVATYSVGSVYGISAKAAQQISDLFKKVLGDTSPTLDAAKLKALADQTVTLAALQEAAGVATLNELLQKSVTIKEFLDLIAAASPSARELSEFKDILAAAGNNNATFLIGQLLNIQAPFAAGVSSANVSVFDLVNGAISVGAMKAGEGGMINTSLSLAFLGKTTLSVLSPPIIAVGPAGKNSKGQWCSQAQSAQMSLRSTFAPFKFTGLDLSVIDIALRVDFLTTTGHLEDLSVVPGQISGRLSSQSTAITLVLTNSGDIDKPIGTKSNFGIAYIGPKILNTGFGIYLPVGEAPYESSDFSFQSRAELPSVKILGAGGVGDTFAGLLGKDTLFEARLLGLKVKITALGNILGLVTVPLGKAIDKLLADLGIQTGSVKMQVIDVDTSAPVLRQ
jgi:uncharacterized membrane protein